MMRVFVVWLLMVCALRPSAAFADEFMNQDWELNPALSNVYMQSVKKNQLFETHQFTTVEGSVSKHGEAIVKIELKSLQTGHDLRDVRMRFLLFEVFKFPYAEIVATLDRSKLKELATKTRIAYPLKFKLFLHGIVSEIEAPVWVTRIGDTSVSVSTIKPIIITAKKFWAGWRYRQAQRSGRWHSDCCSVFHYV